MSYQTEGKGKGNGPAYYVCPLNNLLNFIILNHSQKRLVWRAMPCAGKLRELLGFHTDNGMMIDLLI